MMGLSYGQSKRMAKRYREEGAKGLKHGSAGRESNRRKSKKFRERVLRLVGKKYSGEEGERFGPDRAVRWEEIPGPVAVPAARSMEAKAKKPKPSKPKADHPWRKAYMASRAPGASPEHRASLWIKEISDG